MDDVGATVKSTMVPMMLGTQKQIMHQIVCRVLVIRKLETSA